MHVVQVLSKVNAADKANDETNRYYNGLAEQKGGAKQSAKQNFDSTNVKCVWPSAAAVDGGAGAGAVAFASAPPDNTIPGIRSRTMEGARQPVSTATGAFVYPVPSPEKGKRRPGALAEGLPPGYGRVAPPCGVALVDHLVFSSAGLSTVEGAPVAPLAAAHTGKMAAPRALSSELTVAAQGLTTAEGAPVASLATAHAGRGSARVFESKLVFSDAGLTATEDAAMRAGGGGVHSLGSYNRAGVDAVAALGAPAEVVATTEARYMRTVAPAPKGGKRLTGTDQQRGVDMAWCMRG